mmetsp:Transcript_19301/g.29296  ORF Transcript_19301/g.29296 Transcript_19301/m.29296 type:complete len:276 (-) Transcript_19301:168-995(-)
MSKKRAREEEIPRRESLFGPWSSNYTPPSPDMTGFEKRESRWSNGNEASRQRLSRAQSQRMYLLAYERLSDEAYVFNVLGSTGNAYQVDIGKKPKCTCPDAKKDFMCKHHFFVMIKVLRCDASSKIIFQKSLLTVELNALFERFVQAQDWSAPIANEETRKAFLSASALADIQECCSICFESMENSNMSQLVRCRGDCRKFLHSECFRQWLNAKGKQGVTCPNCRSAWKDDQYQEGYLNFAHTQEDLPTHRDTSTYNQGYRFYHRSSRRRWWGYK